MEIQQNSDKKTQHRLWFSSPYTINSGAQKIGTKTSILNQVAGAVVYSGCNVILRIVRLGMISIKTFPEKLFTSRFGRCQEELYELTTAPNRF